MGVAGTVTMPGQEPVITMAPERFAALKLRNAQTNESIMTFEETAPPGADTTMHLHRGSDETCYVLSGEITFRIGDAVMVGGPGDAEDTRSAAPAVRVRFEPARYCAERATQRRCGERLSQSGTPRRDSLAGAGPSR